MSTLTLDIPSAVHEKLAEQAHHTGKRIEVLGSELLESALQAVEISQKKSIRDVLKTRGRIRSLGDKLNHKIIPGVTLEEVRNVLKRTDEPSLSQTILEQRGPKV